MDVGQCGYLRLGACSSTRCELRLTVLAGTRQRNAGAVPHSHVVFPKPHLEFLGTYPTLPVRCLMLKRQNDDHKEPNQSNNPQAKHSEPLSAQCVSLIQFRTHQPP